MRDMHALGTHLPCKTLSQRPQGEFHGCEGGKEGGAFDGGGGSGEDEGWWVGVGGGIEEEGEGGLGEVEGAFSGGLLVFVTIYVGKRARVGRQVAM